MGRIENIRTVQPVDLQSYNASQYRALSPVSCAQASYTVYIIKFTIFQLLINEGLKRNSQQTYLVNHTSFWRSDQPDPHIQYWNADHRWDTFANNISSWIIWYYYQSTCIMKSNCKPVTISNLLLCSLVLSRLPNASGIFERTVFETTSKGNKQISLIPWLLLCLILHIIRIFSWAPHGALHWLLRNSIASCYGHHRWDGPWATS